MRKLLGFWTAAAIAAVCAWAAFQTRSSAPPLPHGEPSQNPAGDALAESTPESSGRSTPIGSDLRTVEPRVHGTIVVRDPSDAEWTSEDGFFDVALVDSPSERIRVEVKKGNWSTELPVARKLEIVSLVLRGRPATPDDVPEKDGWSTAGSIAIGAVWPSPARVRFIGADSGAELDRVEIARRTNDEHFCLAFPAILREEDFVVRAAESPVDLAALDASGVAHDTQSYWARADGYAWQQFDVEFYLAGELVVKLPPSGSLDLDLIGPIPPAAATLRVWDDLTEPYDPEVEIPVNGKQHFRFDCLPAGRFRATVGIGRHKDDILLGSTEVEIPRGAGARATISTTEAPKSQTARVYGVIVIPAAWGIREFELIDRFHGTTLDGAKVPPVSSRAMSSLAGEPDALGFSMVVPVGNHTLQIGAGEWRIERQIDVDGDRKLRIALRPPVPVVISLTDETTGEVPDIDSLTCWTFGDDLANASRSVQRTPDSRRFEFLAPQGELYVSIGHDAYEGADSIVVVHEPRVEEAMLLRRACGVDVQLMEENSPMRIDQALAIVRPRGSVPSKESEHRMVSSHLRVRVRSAGDYLVEVRGLDDFEPLPVREVRVDAGAFTTVEFEVQRKR